MISLQINNKNLGKTILSRDGKKRGKVSRIIYRWCAGCHRFMPMYIVHWENGQYTHPCPAGCKNNPDGTIQIV